MASAFAQGFGGQATGTTLVRTGGGERTGARTTALPSATGHCCAGSCRHSPALRPLCLSRREIRPATRHLRLASLSPLPRFAASLRDPTSRQERNGRQEQTETCAEPRRRGERRERLGVELAPLRRKERRGRRRTAESWGLNEEVGARQLSLQVRGFGLLLSRALSPVGFIMSPVFPGGPGLHSGLR